MGQVGETIRRGAREGTIPATRVLNEWRFYLEEIAREEAKQRTEPLYTLYDELSTEVRAALIKALPRFRREVPAAIPTRRSRRVENKRKSRAVKPRLREGQDGEL